MFDIGIGEIVIIAVIGLLVFGPERLPRAAADAAKWLRDLRAMASGARKELADSAGLDLSDAAETVRSLQEFHPRRLAADLLKDPEDPGSGQRGSGGSAAGSGGAGDNGVSGTSRPAFDPDAT